MLYAKIYLDKDKDGQDMLVFTSLSAKGIEANRACMVDYIAISPEAKAYFLTRLGRADRVMSRYSGDFELFGEDDSWEHGYFHFVSHDEKNGLQYRTLRDDAPLLVRLTNGCRRAVLDYMIPCENEQLKTLDLAQEIDEGTLWQRHFTAMRERGEEPACDVETVAKTPTAFLTEAQREVIRRDYRARCEEVGEYHLCRNTEAALDLIIGELMKRYKKNGAEIARILGSATPRGGKLTFTEALEMIGEEFELRRDCMHVYFVRVGLTFDGYHSISIALRDDMGDELILTDVGAAGDCFDEVPEEEWVALCREHGFARERCRINRPFRNMEDLYAFIEFMKLIADTYDPLEDEDEDE